MDGNNYDDNMDHEGDDDDDENDVKGHPKTSRSIAASLLAASN